MINEIAEELQRRNIDTAFPLELPCIDDVVEAQEEMLIHIPPNFRDYLLHCSNVIYGQLEPVTVADPNAHTHLPEVTADAWERGMPRDLIVLCPSDNGFYCVEEDDTVHFWRDGDDDAEQVSEDVWQWVRDVWMAE